MFYLNVSWEQRKFENIFDYERPDKYIVSSDEYSEASKTPVLTANKAFILGAVLTKVDVKREKKVYGYKYDYYYSNYSK